MTSKALWKKQSENIYNCKQIEEKHLIQLLRSGIDGIIEGELTPFDLYDTLSHLSRNEVFLCNRIQKKLLNSLGIIKDTNLTQRELLILAPLRQILL